jgi:spermidine dehydrogenase
MSSQEYRDLGMDRRIARRDFLNGVAVTAAAALAGMRTDLGAQAPANTPAAAAVPATGLYPPALTGLRGNYPEAVGLFPQMRAGTYANLPAAVDTNEQYDLVVVGGGISGLSAAYFWRRALGNDQKVLVLDNHDDFGGHAKRNEFQYQGRTYLGYGGTMSIATPFPYSYPAKRLIEELGIEVGRNGDFFNRDLQDKYKLGRGFFFDKEHFGEDRLVAPVGRMDEAFFNQAPLTPAARKDLIRLHGKNPDYMSGMSDEQKLAKLAKMSHQEFLLQHAKMSPDALPFFLGQGGRNNKRVDTMPALEACMHGEIGFDGLGLTFPPQFREGSYSFHFPDGNSSIARLLVGKLIPSSLSSPKQDMQTIVNERTNYAKLDQPGSAMRIRLSSTVIRVHHEGDPATSQFVRVAYMSEGTIKAVRASNVVLACYNAIIPALVPELPAKQKEALAYPAKVPMMYTNVLLRRWTAHQKLGVSNISSPGMPYPSSSLDVGNTLGGYRGVSVPEEPIVLRMTANPNKPGLSRREQNRAGSEQLLTMKFEEFELQIRRQLGRMLGGGGFDPAADIAAITVNRWPYGYAYTYDTLGDPAMPPEQRPHVVGRQRFGRITIANSDAGAAAFTNQAIDEANRAVEELFVYNGLT